MARIYVASSWRNEHQPLVVKMLRMWGHEVYDFRNPAEGNSGFHWSSIDPNWKEWDGETYRKALEHDLAEEGFELDFNAMEWADGFVGVNPCGRSAHLELGWAIGQNKPTAICMFDEIEPELMYKMFHVLLFSDEELQKFAGSMD